MTLPVLALACGAAIAAGGLAIALWRWGAGPGGGDRRVDRTSLALLGVVFLLGLAEIAVLPPWEGFDEIAHWSSIQELADLHHAPVYGVDKLSADRFGYFGPEPRGVDQRGRTYRTEHDRPSATAGGPATYHPDKTLNWQAQHPPLFYVLMTPVYRAAHGLGWVDHLFVLRLVSWLIGWCGLALGALAIERAVRRDTEGTVFGRWTTPLALLWPIIFAGFLADLARLGNDSLCLLLFGGVWLLLLPMLDRSLDGKPLWRSRASAVGLGFIMGAGLWTKAFFGPISLGVGAILVVRAIRARSWSKGFDAAAAVGIAWAIGAGWYLMKLRTTGALTGSDEAAQLTRAGGMLHGLAAHFSMPELLRGLAAMSETVGWAGTWSLTRLSELAMVLVVALLAAVALGYGAKLRRIALGPPAPLIVWAPLAVIAPMAAGLIYHVFLRLAIDGRGAGTPAWYLHVIAPALGMAMAIGWVRPRLFAALAVFSVLYTAASWGAELSLFSGCTAPDISNHYDFAHRVCGVDIATLARLGHPGLAASALVAALGLAVWAAVMSRPAWGRPTEAPTLEAL